MPTAIKCHSIITPDGSVTPGVVVIGDDGRIAEAGMAPYVPDAAQVIDLPKVTLLPGFIDLHVHGGGGFSLGSRDPEEIRSYARWAISHGVTSFLPTICAGSIDEGLGYVRTAAQATGQVEGGANVLGVNLEGPFVNPVRRGALPRGWIAPPDLRLFEMLAEAAAGHLRLMTLAPELPGAMEVLAQAAASGIVVSLGHTDATYEVARDALEAGASHITHAFNAMRTFHHREPGPAFAALERDNVTVELIADGVHLHPATVQAFFHAWWWTALVTDGVPPAGLGKGVFSLGAHEARLERDRVSLPDGTIAGSAATMDQMIRNLTDWNFHDCNLGDIARMASFAPARALGLGDRKGRIAPGYDADLVALDANLNVAMTWVRGRLVYSRDGSAISRAGRSSGLM